MRCWRSRCWPPTHPARGRSNGGWWPAPAASSAASRSSRPRPGRPPGPGSWTAGSAPTRPATASSGCTSPAARPPAPSPRSPTSASGARPPTATTRSWRRSTSGWAAASAPTPRSSTGSRGPSRSTRSPRPWPPCSPATAPSAATARRSTSGRGASPTTSSEPPSEEGPDMAGYKIRDEMNDIEEAPGKLWFWELEEAVIDADRCVQCGACIAACPSDSIGIGADGLPKLVKMCTGCSLCWDFCPRGGLRHEATWSLPVAGSDGTAWKITGATGAGQGLGRVSETYTARVRPRLPGAQDGGVVSALLIALLEAGDIDGALLARESPAEPWKGEPFLARTPDEVIECAGSFYNQTLALTVALLCTKSFNYEKLMVTEVQRRRGIPLEQVGKVDVIHGRMIVEDTDG